MAHNIGRTSEFTNILLGELPQDPHYPEKAVGEYEDHAEEEGQHERVKAGRYSIDHKFCKGSK